MKGRTSPTSNQRTPGGGKAESVITFLKPYEGDDGAERVESGKGKTLYVALYVHGGVFEISTPTIKQEKKTVSDDEVFAGLEVEFSKPNLKGATGEGPYEYAWRFGDGQSSMEPAPRHTYAPSRGVIDTLANLYVEVHAKTAEGEASGVAYIELRVVTALEPGKKEAAPSAPTAPTAETATPVPAGATTAPTAPAGPATSPASARCGRPRRRAYRPDRPRRRGNSRARLRSPAAPGTSARETNAAPGAAPAFQRIEPDRSIARRLRRERREEYGRCEPRTRGRWRGGHRLALWQRRRRSRDDASPWPTRRASRVLHRPKRERRR